ncbi:DUF3710 domain-containing protein, partial [Frankia sp. AgB32]|uniref:DUF3710 domain-containing protein n=1 Tax=Frankia sp. AgB32 TaxID=631119 RepID=UPI00200CCC7C
MFGGRLGSRQRRSAAPVVAAGGPNPAQGTEQEPGAPPTIGPFDLADLPADGRERADFGALLVPRVAGTWLRLSPAGPVPALVVTDSVSAVELSVLAAPRRQGLWATIRADLLATTSAAPDGDATEADLGAEEHTTQGEPAAAGWSPAGGPDSVDQGAADQGAADQGAADRGAASQGAFDQDAGHQDTADQVAAELVGAELDAGGGGARRRAG